MMPTRGTVSARAMLGGDDRRQTDPCCWPILRGAGCVARFLELAQALLRRHDAHHAQLAKSILRRLGFCSPWLAFIESLAAKSSDGWPYLLRAASTSVCSAAPRPDGAHRYAGSYLDADLYWSADRIREWQRQHFGVLAYFNNDGFWARNDPHVSCAPNGLIDRTGQDRSGVWRWATCSLSPFCAGRDLLALVNF